MYDTEAESLPHIPGTLQAQLYKQAGGEAVEDYWKSAFRPPREAFLTGEVVTARIMSEVV